MLLFCILFYFSEHNVGQFVGGVKKKDLSGLPRIVIRSLPLVAYLEELATRNLKHGPNIEKIRSLRPAAVRDDKCVVV